MFRISYRAPPPPRCHRGRVAEGKPAWCRVAGKPAWCRPINLARLIACLSARLPVSQSACQFFACVSIPQTCNKQARQTPLFERASARRLGLASPIIGSAYLSSLHITTSLTSIHGRIWSPFRPCRGRGWCRSKN